MAVRRAAALVAALGVVTAAAAATPALAAGSGSGPVLVLHQGLDGPFGLDQLATKTWVVAESETGNVSRLGPGKTKTTLVNAPGVSGVAAWNGSVYSVLGGGDETGEAPPGPYAPSSVLRTDPDGSTHVIADLLAYELEHNPDGQPQRKPNGKPYRDALSNPFSITASPWGLLVADGGANDVLAVDPDTGAVSTFFVPPNVTDVRECLKPKHQVQKSVKGCDSVPTGVAVAQGKAYISTLGAEVAGAGKVYEVDPGTHQAMQVWNGLTAPTGIAVDPRTTDMYVSEVFYGFMSDPSGLPTTGRITKFADNGTISHAQVMTPTGLRFAGGELYATAGSVNYFFGQEGAGQIVRVKPAAFTTNS